ncbi:MAG: hypothetical protein AOA65_0820 [Candidatus Bathyarchaeota archaeon BA1]|nr:MAG: hypothetical protein AOA65_0820 [Candidatus Bathyarchaeota archaeon BA1]
MVCYEHLTEGEHCIEGLHVEEEGHALALPHQGITIPELEIQKNAEWLALLFDTEGTVGWTRYIARVNRINERYRYEYAYRIPYLSVSMDELASKETVDKGARLLGTIPRTEERAPLPP